jgi:Na+/proline symporter
VFGLYWSRATTQGALLSVALGLGTWLFFIATPPLAEAFPQQLAGLLAALGGMVVGSLAPQYLKDHKGHVHHFEGSGQGQPAA